MSKRSLLVMSAVLGMLFALLPLSAVGAATPEDLFFSEYIEGSSFNKAIEIYNGTGSSVDLSTVTVERYTNGSPTPSSTATLSGSLADGDVFVIAHSSAAAAILAVTDLTHAVANWNGDDAVVLRDSGVVVDSIGQVGVDPGSRWGSGSVTTQDDTLRRDGSVCAGDTDPSDAYDPAGDWVGFAQNTFDGLGSHSATCGGPPPGPSDPLINEFVANHTGSDSNAFVEVLGDASVDYSGFTVLEIEGDSTGAGVIDAVLPVGTTDSAGYWLDSEDMENGTITVVLVEGFSGGVGNDLDTDNDGVFDVTPWVRIVDDVATTDGGSTDRTYSTTVLAAFFDGMPFGAGGASRIPGGSDTDSVSDWVRNDFDGFGFAGFAGTPALGEAVNTSGSANEAISVLTDPVGVCYDPATLIHGIQGAGFVSPDVGNIREIEGIVVGDFEGWDGWRGFYVQEEDLDADADAETSEGIFVFNGGDDDVAVGDLVRVRAEVTEYQDMTELTNVESITVCSAGSPLPSAAIVAFPVVSSLDLEKVEGMAVSVPQTMYINEYFNYDRYGIMVLTDEQRPMQPTAVFEPGSPDAAALADLHARAQISLDDGTRDQNPEFNRHPDGTEFVLGHQFRGGDSVAGVVGVMDHSRNQSWESSIYRIQPTAGATYTALNHRPLAHDSVGGDIEVAAFNVLNYFTTFRSRGAWDQSEFDRQRDKIFEALADIDADVVGLMEIENNTAAIIDLVDGLNAVVGAGTYAYVGTGVIGPDAIKVAFIYKPAVVSLSGSYAVLDSLAFLDPLGTGSDKNRPALAQTFEELVTGEKFTAVVNHLKSKGSSCGPGDDDPDAGSCNATRAAAASLLVDWLAGDPTGSGDADFLILGDLNSYDKEDPIDAIKVGSDDTAGTGDDYTDLIHAFQGEYAYSYVFSGQWGYLDYAMANEALLPQVTGTTEWHINANEPDIMDYDESFRSDSQIDLYEVNAFRSSDHDPVIVGLNLANPQGDSENLIEDLSSLLPTGDKTTDRRIGQAVSNIEDSLNPEFWTSDQTINDKKVFDFQRKAVAQLVLIVESGGPTAAAAQQGIDVLINADRQLAQIELIAAVVRGGSPSKIADAEAALAEAMELTALGMYNEAVNAYKAAWHAATKS